MTPSEYNRCIDLWSDDLYRFARHCSDGEEEADDAVQEAFTSLWEQHEGVALEEAKGFLFVVAQRRIADLFRRVRKNIDMQVDMVAAEGLCHSPAEHYELHDAMRMAMKQLSERQRAILTLHDVEGYDYNEIAEMMQMTYTQVQVSTFRARTKMKQLLSNLGFN